jgi:hypothetical protein
MLFDLGFLTLTFGGSLPPDSTLPNWPMQPSSKGLFALSQQIEFGSHGLLENASSSYGWCTTTGARPLIG